MLPGQEACDLPTDLIAHFGWWWLAIKNQRRQQSYSGIRSTCRPRVWGICFASTKRNMKTKRYPQSSSNSRVNPHVWHVCKETPFSLFSLGPNECLCSSSFLRCQMLSFVFLRSSRKLSSNFLFFFFFFSDSRRSYSASSASGDPHFFQANSSTWYRTYNNIFAYVDLCGLAFSKCGNASSSRISGSVKR